MDFYIRSLLLGVGLAMDACAVSMADGLKEPKMKFFKILFIAILFGVFQAAMPLTGYFVGHSFLSYIEDFIPWIALILLLFIGGKMLADGNKNEDEEKNDNKLGLKVLLLQAVATSIDALSVGFTIANYSINEALICALIICIVTTAICIGAVFIGKKFGTKLGNKACILGGIVLIAIGIEIFISGMFF